MCEMGLGPRLLVVAALTAAALVAYWWHTEREADRRWGERGETRDEGGEQ